MLELNQLQGCGTALVTPFHSDDNIDVAALRKLVDFQIDEGIDFLVPCGTTGESATLSMDEHLLVVETVANQANGRVPVIAGAGSNNTKHAVELSRESEKVGATALLLVTPYYNKPTQEGLYQHYKAIAQHVRIPIILYNVPGRTSSNILPETVERLSEIDNIIAIKEASGNMEQISDLMHRIGDRFIVLSGDDVCTLPIMSLGGKGAISVISNELPKEMAMMVHAALENDYEKARTIHSTLHPLMVNNFIETNPIPVKAVLEMMGKIEANYRLPLGPLSVEHHAKLKSIVQELGLVKQ